MTSGIKRLALTLGLTLALGFTFAPLGCGSSGGELSSAVPGQGDAKVPESVALQLRTCAAKYMDRLGSGDRSVSFEVKLASDGEVDSVALRGSTLGDEELEGCMAHALRALSEDALPLRRSENRPHGLAAPESRALLGQAQALCLLELAFAIGAAYIVVQIYVLATSPSSTAKPKPRTIAVPKTIPVSSKDECTDRYIKCKEGTTKADCSTCIHICTASLEWPIWLCP